MPTTKTTRSVQYECGWRYTEMNTILRRIRRRRFPEPTARERERLIQLREEIHKLKRGEELV